jgi:flagella basal body P-ring formation protein FlgA
MAGCLVLPPGADSIEARDLAPAYPELAAAGGDVKVAPAPEPGYFRIFRGPELRRLAARFDATLAPVTEICIARKTAPADPARLVEAMGKALPEARIELLDYSRLPVPEGAIHFHPETLRGSPGAAIWPGWVEFAPNRRFALWAKVRLNLKLHRVLAVTSLAAGKPIPAAAISEAVVDALPSSVPYLESAAAAAGRWLRVPVAAGGALRADHLEPERSVMRGQTVTVEVAAAGAHLELEAQAEGSGNTGDVVAVRNPSSHKQFLGRVTGPGRVLVTTAPDGGAQ